MIAALGDAGLAIVQRWCSSTIGEGVIYDLRVALFAKVQRMPVAFFTRTQTGALTSRLSNDVVGAQNAVTSTLGSAVSNVVVLATTLTAMAVLEWRLTILALVVLPLFIVPAKRVGLRLQGIQRENMATNAEMNSQMAERFNADITVSRNGETVGGTSIMGLMMLAAGIGTSVTISAAGPQAQEAVDALTELLATKFGEEE